MGWMDTLTSLAGKYGGAAGSMGSVLGAQQAGKAQGKVDQANLTLRGDQNALSRYGLEQNAQNQAAQTDLQRKQFTSQNRSTSAKQALIAALLGGGISPTSISGGQRSGGLLSAMNSSPGAKVAMDELQRQALLDQADPEPFSGGAMVAPPKMTPIPKVDSGGFMSALAQIAQLAGAGSAYLKKPSGEDDGFMGPQ